MIFVVMASRDTSDFDTGSDDYPVCYYPEQDRAIAVKHVKEANEIAATLEYRPALDKREMDELRREIPRLFEVDPFWKSTGTGQITMYFLVKVEPGRDGSVKL